MPITDEDLLARYLPEPMYAYFRAKLPDLEEAELRVQIAECLKFLVLFHFAPGEVLFSDDIDEIWHYWIQQTREYAELCRQLPSGQFLHHSSMDYPPQKVAHGRRDIDHSIDRLVSFFASYIKNFGPVSADRLDYWPALSMLMKAGKWDLEQVQAVLSSTDNAPCETNA